MSEAAGILGIRRQSLYGWLSRHNLLHRCPRIKGCRYVSVFVLDRYREATEGEEVERVVARPYGWIAIRQAADFVGCHRSFIYRAVQKGEVQVKRVRHIHYYCPYDLEQLRLRLKENPLPGWHEIGPYAKEHNVSRNAIMKWLKRNGL